MKRIVILGATLCSLALISCTKKTGDQDVTSAKIAPTVGVTDTEIVIGAPNIESGPQAFWGMIHATMKGYIEKVNQEGGVHGRKVVYKTVDHGFSPAKAIEGARRLVEQDKVFAIMMTGSEAHLAVYKYLEDAGIPDLWILDPSEVYTKEFAKTRFQLQPTWKTEGQMMADWVLENARDKKICTLQMSTSNGTEAALAFKERLSGQVTLAAEESVSLMAVEANASILNLQTKGCDVVYFAHYIPLVPAAIQYAHSRNFKPQWLTLSYNGTVNMVQIAGEAVEGAIMPSYLISETDESDKMKAHKELMEKWVPGLPVTTLSILGHALGELLIETLERAGEQPTRESVIAAAESFDNWSCTTCLTTVTTGPNNHLGIDSMNLVTFKQGKVVPWSK